MARILVDSNIYLKFYAHQQIEDLLPALTEVQRDLLVTTQIVDEVCRNRLSVLAKHIEDFTGKGILAEAPLVHLLPDSESKKVMSTDIAKLNKEAKEIQGRLKSHLDSAVELTAMGKDRVTQSLDKVFSKAIVPKDDQLSRARVRREMGNPPGKRTDPLGDQINWEVFLDSLGDAKQVWIISTDFDYAMEYRKTLYLDALLHRELAVRGVTDVFCFRELSAGLKSYKAVSGSAVNALPSDDALAAIGKVEQEVSQAYPFGLTAPTGVTGPYQSPFIPPISTTGSIPFIATSGVYQYASSGHAIQNPLQPGR